MEPPSTTKYDSSIWSPQGKVRRVDSLQGEYVWGREGLPKALHPCPMWEGAPPSAGVLVPFPGHALSKEDLQKTLVGDIPLVGQGFEFVQEGPGKA